MHGLGVNQDLRGLSGILTVGSVADYASLSGSFNPAFNAPVRYIAIKDIQVLANGNVMDQEDSQFCAPAPAPPETRNGSCAGTDQSNNPMNPGAGNYTGGKWFFSINGLVYPTINVNRQSGEVWRLLNSSASRSYDLTIQNDKDRARVVFQVWLSARWRRACATTQKPTSPQWPHRWVAAFSPSPVPDRRSRIVQQQPFAPRTWSCSPATR